MSGLDPLGRREVRDLLLEQRERGTTVLFSTHILPDVEALCDRAAILVGGRLTRVTTVGELVSDRPGAVEILCARAGLVEIPPALAGVIERSERADATVFTIADGARLDETLGWLVRSRVAVRSVAPQRSTLEELFVADALAADGAERERRSA